MIIALIFIFLGIAFMVGTLIYIRRNNNLQSFNVTDKIELGNNKKGLTNLWGINNIKDEIVTLNNGEQSIIVELDSIEYNLLQEGEKDLVDGELIRICQMLKFPVQFLEIKQKINMQDNIERIRINTLNANNYIKEYAKNIIEHLERIQDRQELFERRNYMIISSFSKDKTAETELKEFYQSLRYHLMNININTRILNNDEIIELIYEQLHKGSKSNVKDIIDKGGLDLYVTNKGERKVNQTI